MTSTHILANTLVDNPERIRLTILRTIRRLRAYRQTDQFRMSDQLLLVCYRRLFYHQPWNEREYSKVRRAALKRRGLSKP